MAARVFVNGGGQLTIDATSKIDSNTATEAAGVYNGGTVTMNGGSISGNSGRWHGRRCGKRELSRF